MGGLRGVRPPDRAAQMGGDAAAVVKDLDEGGAGATSTTSRAKT
jgi:hypothetical protein